MRQLIRRLKAALWAFRNPDDLSMLYHNLATDAAYDGPMRGANATARAHWYLTRYLSKLPIR